MSVYEDYDVMITRFKELLDKSDIIDYTVVKMDAFTLLDRIENMFLQDISSMDYTRLSSEKFESIQNSIDDVMDAIKAIREKLSYGEVSDALKIAEELRRKIKRALTLANILAREMPMGVVYRAVPQYVKSVPAPRQLIRNPVALQIYNLLLQNPKKTIPLTSLPQALGVTEDEINKAIDELLRLGFITFVIHEGESSIRLKEVA